MTAPDPTLPQGSAPAADDAVEAPSGASDGGLLSVDAAASADDSRADAVVTGGVTSAAPVPDAVPPSSTASSDHAHPDAAPSSTEAGLVGVSGVSATTPVPAASVVLGSVVPASVADSDFSGTPNAPTDADDLDDELEALMTPDGSRAARWAPKGAGATALTWVDPTEVADHTDAAAPEASATSLWAGARLQPAVARAGFLVPVGVLVGLVASYAGAALLWPLHEVAPTVQSVEVTPVAAPAAEITWPAQGSAAVGIAGLSTVSSTVDASAIASITKVISAMMVLDRQPLAPGEQGQSYSFTRADSQSYMTYLRSDQSALDVPVNGSLTEYQMLQGVLLGSANNYIDRLTRDIWGTDAAFAAAAEKWLSDRGIQGITIMTPSGFDERNTATPDALVAVAEVAMQNPVFAEIVGTPSVDLPGAGVVNNTNGMLADPGVVGVKTGTLYDSWNLLTAKNVSVDDTTVRLYAAVLTQADNESRLEATRSLFAQVEAALQAQLPVVPAGTVVGTVDTLWGEPIDIVTDADSDVVLWNAATATTALSFDLGESRDEGDTVGELTTTGPLNSATSSLSLAQDVEGPTAWWRLTHPLELLGLTSDQR
ncbi:D-alanyl-D-alanine carboxypeptidase [Microbacterium sp. ZW T5_45]|uniref:D-alanyl-D-alanine carboxypeptidase n=1 Tax=Microbacterium sp. ZW T5_45 TaxID=3378080 RepID=UPI003853F793